MTSALKIGGGIGFTAFMHWRERRDINKYPWHKATMHIPGPLEIRVTSVGKGYIETRWTSHTLPRSWRRWWSLSEELMQGKEVHSRSNLRLRQSLTSHLPIISGFPNSLSKDRAEGWILPPSQTLRGWMFHTSRVRNTKEIAVPWWVTMFESTHSHAAQDIVTSQNQEWMVHQTTLHLF